MRRSRSIAPARGRSAAITGCRFLGAALPGAGGRRGRQVMERRSAEKTILYKLQVALHDLWCHKLSGGQLYYIGHQRLNYKEVHNQIPSGQLAGRRTI
jgi:hypothetical protein